MLLLPFCVSSKRRVFDRGGRFGCKMVQTTATRETGDRRFFSRVVIFVPKVDQLGAKLDKPESFSYQIPVHFDSIKCTNSGSQSGVRVPQGVRKPTVGGPRAECRISGVLVLFKNKIEINLIWFEDIE